MKIDGKTEYTSVQRIVVLADIGIVVLSGCFKNIFFIISRITFRGWAFSTNSLVNPARIDSVYKPITELSTDKNIASRDWI